MKISSPAFADNQMMPAKYSCDGEGVSPTLSFADAPAGAKTLALIADDPDAPAGTFVHWVVWNIPANSAGFAEGQVPAGAVVGQNTRSQNRFGPACPPTGTHRYFFKLYALDSVLDLPASTTKEDLLKAMDGHILDQAQVIGLYQR